MKKRHFLFVTLAIVFATMQLVSCGNSCGTGCGCANKANTCIPNRCACNKGGGCKCDSMAAATAQAAAKNDPNVLIFIDLSNRLLLSKQGIDQKQIDTALIGHINDELKNFLGADLKNRKGSVKVFFYPAPTDPQMATLAQKLDINFGAVPVAGKPAVLTSFNDTIKENLNTIYEAAIKDKKWVGSDIWGFFAKSIQNHMRAGARNILIILTDGYILHVNNKVPGRYITHGTLAKGDTLTPATTGLEDLEVLFLEVNETTPGDYEKIKSTVEKWLHDMGVGKCQVLEHDLPGNNYKPIADFLDFPK